MPQRDRTRLVHYDVMRQAFLELKRYDRHVARSDRLLCRIEDAWRDKDADALTALLCAALAERVEGD